VDNPIYTNRMIVWHLDHAFKTLDWLQRHAPSQAQYLIQRLDLSDQRLDHWRDVMAKMYIPRDAERTIYLQFDGFFDLKFVDLKKYEPRVTPIDTDLLLSHEGVQASQILKQADVVMLIALLGSDLGPHDELMRNWNTYEPRTAHDSSLSPAMHAWVAARLGMIDTAYAYWLKAAGLDLENNKGNVRDGIHAAATGSLWQAIVFGFAGLQLGGSEGWTLDPQLPPWWKSVSFSFYYHGTKQHIHLTP
jgi:kojibiose phosphorylase